MWRRKRSNLDRREEMQAHLRMEADQLEAEGLTPEEAKAKARDRFGYTPHLDPVDVSAGSGWIDVLARDLSYAVRQLSGAPISTLTILASLIVGIGVNTAIFSLTDQALVRALPVSEPQEIVQIEWQGEFIGGGRGYGSLIPHPLYVDLRDEQRVFRELAARSPGEVTIVTDSGSERAQVELVTGTYFRLLGVRPFLGRTFTEEDDKLPDGHPVVVLSHAYWQTRFGGDPDVIGRELRLNARSMTIVGVAPAGFHGTDWSLVPAAWVPMMMNDLVHDWGRLSERRVRFQHVFARLEPGVTQERAEASLQPWFHRYIRADIEREGWPGAVEPGEMERYLASKLAVRPGGQGQAARQPELRQPILILTAATALLLLLACLNVANLSLARAVSRQRDAGVRVALGASRRRIMAERLVEAGLLATAGGVAGILLAPLVGRWILSYLQLSGTAEMGLTPELDGRTLMTAALIAVAATLLSGVGPAWFAASARPVTALKAQSCRATGGLGLRKLLVVSQVSLALIFLVGAALFGETLRSLRETGPGFSTDRLLTFSLAPTNEGYAPLASKRALRRILDEIRELPGVDVAGVGLWPILEGGGWANTVLIEGRQRMVTEEPLPMNAVSPGFFDALGVSIRRGRDFDEHDAFDDSVWRMRSAIVSQAFVDHYLQPGEDPIGVRIDFGGDDSQVARMEIIGVVDGFREHGLRDSRAQVFFPVWERPAAAGSFYVRTRGAHERNVAELRDVVEAFDPLLAITALRTLDDQVDRLLIFERMLAALGRAFAVFATLLAMIGIYGVLSFSAQSRTKEIGIRVALGAPKHSAAGLILAEALRLGAAGVAVALPVVWGLSKLIESQLFGVDGAAPAIAILAGGMLLLVCLSASAVPAWRASTVNPLDAFRME